MIVTQIVCFPFCSQSKKIPQILRTVIIYSKWNILTLVMPFQTVWSNPMAKREFVLQKISFQIKITLICCEQSVLSSSSSAICTTKFTLLMHHWLTWSSYMPQTSRKPSITKHFSLLLVIVKTLLLRREN